MSLKTSKGLKAILGVLAAVVIVYLVGTLLSSPIVNAKKISEINDGGKWRIFERY